MKNEQTERVYYNYTSSEPYGAQILELRPAGNGSAHIILDKTIFYPEGGGQPADRGTINGVPLTDIQEKGGEIFHVVDEAAAGNAAVKPGPAELILDSRRRRDITVQHTGQHLLSGTIFRMTGSNTVSMHLGDETCTIDIDGAQMGVTEMGAEQLLAVEDAVADSIEKNLPVITHLCPPEDISALPLRKFPPQGEDVIRVVEIEGFDFSPCCGTHLASTAEIGMLRILAAEKYKGMTRITFIAGRRVLLDSRLLRRNAALVSRSLSVPINETGKAVVEFLEKAAHNERRLKAFEEEAARAKAQALLSKAALLVPAANSSSLPLVVECYAEAGIDEILSIGKAAQKETEIKKEAGAVFVLASARDLKIAAFCTAKGFDLRPLVKEAFEAHCGRGGGGPAFFQGSFAAKEAMDAFLSAMEGKSL